MKYQALIIALIIIIPLFTSAEIVISNSGTIKSVTSSSASTGGNSVDTGNTVVTGDAHASSKSEVTAGGDGADVHIETSTTVNGETNTQTVQKTLKTGEPVSVEVNSKSISGKKPDTSIKVNNQELSTTNAATVTEETVVRTDPQKPNVFLSIATKISLTIKNIFSVFKFW